MPVFDCECNATLEMRLKAARNLLSRQGDDDLDFPPKAGFAATVAIGSATMRRSRRSAAIQRPSSADVAALAGVSQSAVSRALRPGGSASPAVRAKVAAAAEALGYRPNLLASAMITRRTSVIAVILASATTAYYPEVLAGICHAIAAKGCRAMVFMVDDAASEASAVNSIISYRIDAAIALVSLTPSDIALLERHDIRLVFYNREGPNDGRHVVTCDHEAAGEAMALHLLSLGHRRCAVVEGMTGSPVSALRVRGIERARDADGRRLDISARASGDYSYESGLTAVRALGDRRGSFSAIIGCNDAMAVAAVDVVRKEWACAVPQDYAICGFDGAGFAAWIGYRLTTVVQPVAHLCAAAVDMLTGEGAFELGERRSFRAVLRPGATTIAEGDRTEDA